VLGRIVLCISKSDIKNMSHVKRKNIWMYTNITTNRCKQDFPTLSPGADGCRLRLARFSSHNGAFSSKMILHANVGVLARTNGHRVVTQRT